MEVYISNSRGPTVEIGENLGKTLNGGEVVAFRGYLGSGKTCFTSGLASGLVY